MDAENGMLTPAPGVRIRDSTPHSLPPACRQVIMHNMLSCKQIIVILLPVLIALLFHLFFHFNRKRHADLVIGILSSRYDFIQRETIRRTWLNRSRSEHAFKTKSLFVVGDDDCEIPFEDRISVFGCERLFLNASLISVPDLRLFRSSDPIIQTPQTKNCAPFLGLSFQVTAAPDPCDFPQSSHSAASFIRLWPMLS